MNNLDELVKQRRKRLADESIPENAEKWGVALSGGGVRSATFSLGLIKSLARKAMLLRFDLLSTVSGGGYAGATVGRLFDRARSAEDVREVEKGLGAEHSSWALWWLRANGRYLIPSGVLDKTFVIALFFRNLAGVHFELGLMAILAGCLLALLNTAAWTFVAWRGYANPGEFFETARWLSPWLPVVWVIFLPVLAVVGLVNLPRLSGASRWRGNQSPSGGRIRRCLPGSSACWGVLVTLGFPQGPFGLEERTNLWRVSFAFALVWLLAAPLARFTLREKQNGHRTPSFAAAHARSKLTQELASVFRWGAAVLVLGLVERAAWFLAFERQQFSLVDAGLALALAAALLRAVLPLASSLVPGRASTGVLVAGAGVLGYVLVLLLAALWISIVYRAVLGALFINDKLAPLDAAFTALALLVPVGLYCTFTGRNLDFLNLSSLHSFYRARLVRSYLGAANPGRFKLKSAKGTLQEVPRTMPADAVASDINEVDEDDDVCMASYAPMRWGGPVHLVNICINQTSDPRGGVFNLDRRGLPLSVAPGGLMRVCLDKWSRIRSPFVPSLGTFIAISGAAVAPGLGSMTRGGISALATFTGVRLGYWWSKERREGELAGDSSEEVHRRERRESHLLTAKSRRILNEMLGNFQGAAGADWFLTDGGHFENTGAYALIAERCKVILLSDAGADPDYAFGDLENLVRKARIDLHAEITFTRPRTAAAIISDGGRADLEQLKEFGTLNDLASSQSNVCLALATITYAERPDDPGILICVKPNLCQGLPVDLVNFKAANPHFPQETTADQFFLEAQWESYFRLGQELARGLTVEFVDEVARAPRIYFAPDDETTLEKAVTRESAASVHDEPAATVPASGTAKPSDANPDDAKAKEPEPKKIGRLPSRIAKSAMGATLGLSAVAAIGVSVWQTFEGWRAASEKQTESERQSLTALAELWRKAMHSTPPANAADIDAVGALATALLRTADTLCPTGDAAWFIESKLARRIATDAHRQCDAIHSDVRPNPCMVLSESGNGRTRPDAPNCIALSSAEGRESANGGRLRPSYWATTTRERRRWTACIRATGCGSTSPRAAPINWTFEERSRCPGFRGCCPRNAAIDRSPSTGPACSAGESRSVR